MRKKISKKEMRLRMKVYAERLEQKLSKNRAALRLEMATRRASGAPPDVFVKDVSILKHDSDEISFRIVNSNGTSIEINVPSFSGEQRLAQVCTALGIRELEDTDQLIGQYYYNRKALADWAWI